MIYVISSLILLLILIIILTCTPNEANNEEISIINNVIDNRILTPTLIQLQDTKKIFRIFSDFASSEICHRGYNKNKDSLEYNNIVFTTNDDFTHAVIINKAMPKLAIPKENVIGFSCEPPYYLGMNNEFIEYAKKNISAYYMGDLKHNSKILPKPFIKHIGYVWHASLQQTLFPKIGFMSIIFSDKKETPGQQYRHQLVQAILKTDLPIDIFGRGCKSLFEQDNRVKGEFHTSEPYQNYKFTIAIENFALSHYVSEKFIDPLTFNTVPLYYGASCMDVDFSNQFIRLCGDITKDMELINFVITHSNNLKLAEIDHFKVWKTFSLVEHLKSLYNLLDEN